MQVGLEDLVELHVSPDSADVAVGRTLQVQALTLDGSGSLLVGLDVAWMSVDPTVAGVDDDGLVTGVSAGSTQVVASAAGLADTAIVVVMDPAVLVLSDDSVAFSAQVGEPDPAPEVLQITNAGVLPLTGLAVDSIVYDGAVDDWLTAELGATTGPTDLTLTPTLAGITTPGTYTALVWVSAVDADDSPTAVEVVLEVAAGDPTTIEVSDGDGQTAQVGQAVDTPPSVLVSDDFGNPVPGVDVTFTVTGGGGSVTGSPATTDAAGIATVGSWQLGDMAGVNTLDATAAAVGTVSFTATGVAGPATRIEIVSGDGQNAVAGSAVTNPLSVVALDALDNEIEGVEVVFSVQSGGGSITGGTQTTDADGIATAGTWTLGTSAGENTVEASAASIPDAVTFTATGLPGGLDELVLWAGDAQTDTVAATLPTQYAVRVEDVNDNGIPGITVSWQVTGGGGSIDLTSDTDADGVAVATRVLGTAVGTHTAQASVGGLGSVGFTATANAGTPSQLGAAAGGGQSATVNTAVATAPSVIVTDNFGNPIGGQTVTFAVTSAGGSISPAGAMVTQADGTATLTTWTLGTVAASESDTVEVTPSAGTVVPNPLRITATATADAPADVSIVAGNNQTAITGTNVTTPPTVLVEDQFGNPVPNWTVDFTTSGGSVGSPSPTTDAAGEASTSWAPNVSAGSVQTDGTFPNVLDADVQGTALSVSFDADAIYSFETHVDSIFVNNCTGCHGGTGGLTFVANDASANHNSLVDMTSGCSGLPRVSSAGGTTGVNDTVVLLYLTAGAAPPCGFDHIEPGGWESRLALIEAWVRNSAPDN